MPPLNKAKAAGVSASSFQDLRAELAKKEEEFSKSKVANKSAAVVGGVKRPDKVRMYSLLFEMYDELIYGNGLRRNPLCGEGRIKG